MEHLRFQNRVAGLTVDAARREQQMSALTPADRSFVILFSARSGSSWLTGVLSGTKKLGRPEEFINPDFVRDVAQRMNALTPDDLLASLRRVCKTQNGVFGLEARAIDVTLLGFDAFRDAFAGEALFFHLWRENIVAQGLSLYRAVTTARFHSSDGAAAVAPPFDAEKILGWMHHIIETENDNIRLLGRLGGPARRLRYEEIVADRQATIEAFAHALAVPFTKEEFAAAPAAELKRLSDDWNEAAEARLRAEHAAAIARLESLRLIRRSDQGTAPGPPGGAEWDRGYRAGLAGRSPRNNPFPGERPRAEAWSLGWAAGWGAA